jgi:hypothetical protein
VVRYPICSTTGKEAGQIAVSGRLLVATVVGACSSEVWMEVELRGTIPPPRGGVKWP